MCMYKLHVMTYTGKSVFWLVAIQCKPVHVIRTHVHILTSRWSFTKQFDMLPCTKPRCEVIKLNCHCANSAPCPRVACCSGHTSAAATASKAAAFSFGLIHENIAVFALQLLQAAATAPPAAWKAVVPRLASARAEDFPKPTRVKKRAGLPCQNDILVPYKC